MPPINEYDNMLVGNKPAAVNEYDAAIGEQQDENKVVLRQSMQQAASTTPERAAQVIDLSRRSKLPAPIVERNFDTLSKKFSVEGNDYDAIMRQTPKLAEWLKDGENAAVAADDIARMGSLEWMVTAPSRAWRRGTAQVEFGKLSSASMFRDLSAEEHGRMQQLRLAMQEGGDLGAETWFGKALTGGAQQLPMLLGGLTAGAKTGAPMALTFGTAATIAGQLGPQVAAPEELLTVPAATMMGYYIGSTTGSAEFGFHQEAGHAFEEFSKFKDELGRPLDRDVARAAAIAAGGINAGLEAFQLNTLMRTIPGADKLYGAATRTAIQEALRRPTVRAALGQMMRGYARTMTTETITEVAQRAVTILSGELGKVASGQEIAARTSPDILADLANEGIEAAQAFTYLSAPGHVMRAGHDATRIREAKKQEAFFTALGEGVSESKTFQRMPDKVQEFISQATQDGPIETVYVPVESWIQYFQEKGLDPKAVAGEVLGSTESYENAVSTGTDMPIKMSLYATRLAPTEHNAFFAQELRLAPDQMNAREAVEFEARIAAEEKAANDAQQQQAQTSAMEQGVSQITDQVKQKLVDAGVEASTAQAYAATYGAAFRSIGERSGMDPAALFERYGLQINREGVTQPGQTEMGQRGMEKFDAMFPRAAETVDGRVVRKSVPNTSSIAATFSDYDTLPGVREVPISAFDPEYVNGVLSRNLDERTQRLSEEIAASGELNPLIVGVDAKGPYIIEGGHRFDALIKSGAKSFPAIVAVDGQVLDKSNDSTETINVDGVERQATNSEGQPIAGTPESLVAFWRWFGDSKVVDEKGRPLLVYHAGMFDELVDPIPQINGEGFHFGTKGAALERQSGKIIDDFIREIEVDEEGGRFYWKSGTEDSYDVRGEEGFDTATEARSDAERYATEYGENSDIEPMPTTAAYLRIVNPKRLPDSGSDWTDAVSKAKREGHDGIAYRNKFEDKGSASWIVFKPEQIKSATGNRGTFDPTTGNILNQSSNVDRDLIIQHNVTAANLLHSMKLGGFPVPSLAVSKAADSLTSFGEITLIGPREMADPRGYARTRVFGADIYSPRYPTIEYKFDRAGENVLGKIIAKHAKLTGLKYFDLDSLQKEGAKYLRQHPAVIAEYLDGVGIKVARQEADAEGHYSAEDRSNRATEFALLDAVRKSDELRDGLDQFAEMLLLQMNPTERIFKGFTYSGNRSYTPHTLENVVRILKKELRAGETAGNIYGIGQLRAKFTPQFRSLSSIKDKRDLIVSKEKFEEIKKEIEGDFFAIAEAMTPYYNTKPDPFRFTDTVMAVIEESPRGLDRALKEYGFSAIPDDLRNDIYQFVTRLRNMPTEYFEAKIMREVDLAEFRAAVVPDNAAPEVVRALLSRGVTIDTYKHGNEADRKQAVKALADRLGDTVMFQENAEEKRGRIRWGGERQFNIDLLKGADLSTFLHESGHFWLEVLGDIYSELRIAPDDKLNDQQRRMKHDYDTLLAWLGVDDRSKIGVAQHEKFARGIEAYLMEGRAPSAELRSVFAKFRAWMLSIYRSLRSLDVSLTPEVRDAMDRMFATDAEIEAAQNEAMISPLFTDAKSAGMTDVEFNAYKGRLETASARAKDELQAKLLRTLQREREKWWKSEREKERAEVAAEVYARREYIALSVLQSDKMPNGDALPYDLQRVKLDRKALTEAYGEEFWKGLPRGTTAAKQGVHPNTAAELLGYGSGDELVKGLQAVRPMRQTIETLTDERMRAKHGDMLVDGTMIDAAREAVHNEERVKVIEAELRALAKLRRESARAVAAERQAATGEQQRGVDIVSAPVPPLSAVRQMAEGRVAASRVRDLTPGVYLTAARKNGQAAIKAAAAGDYETALALKQRELINVELFRYATRAIEDVRKTVDYLQSFGEAGKRGRIGKAGQDYLDQIDGFLDRYDFARVPLKALDRRKSLAAWVAEKERQGETVDLPADVIVEKRINWKDMTVEELSGVRDSVKHIEHLARLKNRLLTAKRNKDLAEVVGEISDSIREHAKGEARKSKETRLPGEAGARFVDGWFGSHRKIASIARELDGHEDGGALWEYVIRPLNEAGDREAQMNSTATRALAKLFNAYKGADMRALYVKSRVDAIGENLTKMARLVVALNWGNADNRQKLMDGYQWNESQVAAILDTLDERDWKFVQGVWDFIDAYWPEIEAKEKRVKGIAPEKVQASPVKTRFGDFAGGYYPLKYDDRQSPKAQKDLVKETAEMMMKSGYGRETTRRGHTKDRVEGVREPIRLDLGVIFEHTTQVIHDLSHHEALIDVNRIMNAKAITGAVIEHYGNATLDQFTDAIRDIAAGDVGAQQTVERAVNWVRQGVSIAAMGWNLMTSLLQPMGLSQSMVRVGPKWIGRGLARWMRDASGMENSVVWIREKSTFMRNRMNTQMREINEIRNQVGVNTGKFSGWVDEALRTVTLDKVNKQAVADSYFWLIQKAQQIADVPTWIGAYEKALSEGNDDARSIALADQAVLDSQGGGQMKDLAAIQRGGPWLKLWTNFYSYFNVTYNLMSESGKRTNWKSPSSIGRLAVDFLMLYTVPATLGFLMKDALVGKDDEDPETWRKKLLQENIAYLFGSMILMRELGSSIQGFDYRGPAGSGVFASMARLIKQAGQGEPDAAFWRALNDTAGAVLHYPAGQVKRSVDGYVAMQEGRTRNPMALIVGAPKE